MSTIRFTGADQGEHWLVGGETTTIKVSGRETEGEMLVLETRVPPGGGPPNLARHDFVETFHVLEGEFEFGTMDAAGGMDTIPAAVGDTVFVPRMAWHKYKNVGDGLGRLFTVFAETAIEDIAGAIGQKVENPDNPPAPEGPPSEEDARRAMEILRRYKIEIMPPGNA